MSLQMGMISNTQIQEKVDAILQKNIGRFRMKSEQIFSKFKGEMISKIRNLSKYENELLVGTAFFLF